jgi:regulator of sigma D
MLNQKQKVAQQWIHESGQKVGIWPDRQTGGYTPRFFVHDYITKTGKKHSQRSYRKFKTAKEAKVFCNEVCSYLTPAIAGKEKIITAIVKTLKAEAA